MSSHETSTVCVRLLLETLRVLGRKWDHAHVHAQLSTRSDWGHVEGPAVAFGGLDAANRMILGIPNSPARTPTKS